MNRSSGQRKFRRAGKDCILVFEVVIQGRAIDIEFVGEAPNAQRLNTFGVNDA